MVLVIPDSPVGMASMPAEFKIKVKPPAMAKIRAAIRLETKMGYCLSLKVKTVSCFLKMGFSIKFLWSMNMEAR